LLLAFANTVIVGFRPRRNPTPYLCSFQTLKWGLLFDESRGLTGIGVLLLLLALASALILVSQPHGTHDHNLLPDGSGSLQTSLLDKFGPVTRNIIIHSFPPTSQETHSISITTPNRSILFREIIAVYCEKHKK
jgi:hypothetical protein